MDVPCDFTGIDDNKGTTIEKLKTVNIYISDDTPNAHLSTVRP